MIADKKALNAIATPLVNEIVKGEDFVVLQYKTDCLAEFAYYIESSGESAVIDPMRDIQPYLNTIDEKKTKLKYIFETHCHADFVSGHLDLCKKSGAKIVFGPGATGDYR
jgi:hydroxyacylglutathione hydrolase